MNMLAIDTSTQIMGIAIMKDDKVASEITTQGNNDHSSQLMPFITQLMNRAAVAPEELDKIIVANGPGSYTGTRIGVTTAKTMAWALQIPIITVSSLKVLAMNGACFDGYICPFIDAGRGTVFTALYKWEANQLETVREETNILFTTWLAELNKLEVPVIFLSPDIIKFTESIGSLCPDAVIPGISVQHIRPSHLFQLQKGIPATNVHDVVPNYLRITEAESNWMKEHKHESQK